MLYKKHKKFGTITLIVCQSGSMKVIKAMKKNQIFRVYFLCDYNFRFLLYGNSASRLNLLSFEISVNQYLMTSKHEKTLQMILQRIQNMKTLIFAVQMFWTQLAYFLSNVSTYLGVETFLIHTPNGYYKLFSQAFKKKKFVAPLRTRVTYAE